MHRSILGIIHHSVRSRGGMYVSDDSQWELAPDHAHPKARLALTSAFFWSCIDDNTPFGNDNGAGTLSFYREWRATHLSEPANDFLTALFHDWGVAANHW